MILIPGLPCVRFLKCIESKNSGKETVHEVDQSYINISLTNSSIIDPVIKPLPLLFIPEYRVDCLFSCCRSYQETLRSCVVSNNFCQESNVKFHLDQHIQVKQHQLIQQVLYYTQITDFESN